MEIFVEQPEEILIKKFFYRTESLKIRDFLDAYIVLRDPLKTESTRLILRNFLKRKEETLRKRVAYLQEVVKSEGILNILQKLSVSPFLIGKVLENFIQTVVKEIFEKSRLKHFALISRLCRCPLLSRSQLCTSCGRVCCHFLF